MGCDKKGYSKSEVTRVERAVYKTGRNVKLRVYECPDCWKWHLTQSFHKDY